MNSSNEARQPYLFISIPLIVYKNNRGLMEMISLATFKKRMSV